ncbi:MAG: 4-hydroxyphenylpyruvate dioxygenase [Acidobacteria bacterium]|nr:4-hydroxyphenylpyruvate dioxygenase [Acidobacteriota bacterium]
MANAETGRGLGIVGWDSYEFVVADLERSRHFYTEQMLVPEAATLADNEAAARGERALLYSAGKAQVVCVTPTDPDSRAGRWLRRHPDGVAVLGLRVRSVEETRRRLEDGDVRFRFVERAADALPPGFRRVPGAAERNPYELQVIDHVTSNFLTIEPHVTWLRDVMGFEEYWRVHFHTSDLRGGEGGSGLASIVMWDPESGIKLANNEPAAPNYEASQIYTFVEANHGAGVQHVAFHVPTIVPVVEGLRRSGIDFLDTPATYYDMLPARLAERRVGNLSEDVETLRRLGVLVDGEDDRYLLQIFMVEGGVMYEDASAGPFFYEVIQRRGARGFGEGNFRALFEAIERDQERRIQVKRQFDAGAGS